MPTVHHLPPLSAYELPAAGQPIQIGWFRQINANSQATYLIRALGEDSNLGGDEIEGDVPVAGATLLGTSGSVQWAPYGSLTFAAWKLDLVVPLTGELSVELPYPAVDEESPMGVVYGCMRTGSTIHPVVGLIRPGTSTVDLYSGGTRMDALFEPSASSFTLALQARYRSRPPSRREFALGLEPTL